MGATTKIIRAIPDFIVLNVPILQPWENIASVEMDSRRSVHSLWIFPRLVIYILLQISCIACHTIWRKCANAVICPATNACLMKPRSLYYEAEESTQSAGTKYCPAALDVVEHSILQSLHINASSWCYSARVPYIFFNSLTTERCGRIFYE